MSNDEILAWAASARIRAGLQCDAKTIDSNDSIWTLIFDAESLVKDGPTFLARDMIERMIAQDTARLQ